ncbi:MAG: hypothetical protein ACRDNF_21755 [Streptosporangiaceae bacterium]
MPGDIMTNQPGLRGLRLLAATVLFLGLTGALTAAPAQALPRAGTGRASAPRLWHPSAFGHSPWVTPATGLAGSPVRGPDGGWQTEPTPNPGGLANGILAAISCGGPRACIAVGSYVNGAGTTVTLAQLWNGTAWHTLATPNPAGSGGSQLAGISCAGPYACTASGYYLDAAGVTVPLAERWNGASWRIQPVPAPASATASGFFAVACRSARTCTAVGTYDNSAGEALTLAEVWNGTAWSIQATPNPAGAVASELDGVSCTSPRACIAVGVWEGNSGVPVTLAEVWNGAGWHIQHTPTVAGSTSSQFTGVSCATAYACTATGYSRDSSGNAVALAEHWNGIGWQVQSTPIPAGATASELGAVSCTSPRACTAAGAYVMSNDTVVTLAEAWNGSGWVIQSTPNPAGATTGQLNGVSCRSPGACASAGFSVGSTGFSVPLAEGWNGSAWRIHATPSPTGARISQLEGVSCPVLDSTVATACTAVGSYDNATVTSASLAEAWNGSAWSIQATPNPAGAIGSYLQAVSCPSASACIAVGDYQDHPLGASFALAETWNGSAWSLQSIPSPAGTRFTSLQAVSCTAADACTATGFYRNHAQVQQALAERWNGTKWTIQAAVTPGKLSLLYGAACTSASSCTAVGWYSTGVGDGKPLAEAWNGTSWQVQKVTLPAGSQGGALSGVSCTSASACTAGGTYFASPGGAFAERWNGTKWSFQAVPQPPNAGASTSEIGLTTVACSSASACIGIGNYTPGNLPTTFAAAWNGTKWSLEPIGLPTGTVGSTLSGASCAAPHCVAVGNYFGQAQLPVTLAVGRSVG